MSEKPKSPNPRAANRKKSRRFRKNSINQKLKKNYYCCLNKKYLFDKF